MAESSSASVLHQEMIHELSKNLNHNLGDVWDDFKGLLRGHFEAGPAQMKSIKTMHDAMSELEIKGLVSEGNYNVLKDIFDKMKHATCGRIVDKFTKRIKKIKQDTLTMMLYISEQPAASSKKRLYKILQKTFTSKMEEMNRINGKPVAKPETDVRRFFTNQEMKPTFETSTRMQIKFHDVSEDAKTSLMEKCKTKELSRFFQENFITKEVLQKCESESIEIDISMPEEHHPHCEMKRRREQTATKGDVEDAVTKLGKDIKSTMVTQRDIKGITEMLTEVNAKLSHLPSSDNADMTSSRARKSRKRVRKRSSGTEHEDRDVECSQEIATKRKKLHIEKESD